MRSNPTQCNLCLYSLTRLTKRDGAGSIELLDGVAVELATDRSAAMNLFKFSTTDFHNANAHFCYDCVRGLKRALVCPLEESAE